MTKELQPRTYDRTKYEASLDVQYACVLNRLNEKLYNRLDAALGLVGLAGGSSAVAAGYGGHAELTVVIGAVLATLSIVERVIGASRKAEVHRQAQASFAELAARAPSMSLQDIDADLARLRAATPDGIDGLSAVAYNRNLTTHGRTDYLIAEGPWSRVLGALV